MFWFSWSQCALGLDQYEAYLARLEKAIAADPATYKPVLADAYVTVAGRHQQRGDDAKYVEYLARAVGLNPLSARLHLLLGDAHWLADRRPAAVEQYRLVLELEPDHGDRPRLLNRIRTAESAAATVVEGAAAAEGAGTVAPGAESGAAAGGSGAEAGPVAAKP
jgi:tetratricopeptide (TPR) repeat protein